MSDILDRIDNHYRPARLVDRLRTALASLGPDDRSLTPEQLGGLDQFHTRGLAATAEIAQLAGIGAEMSVLDVGSGLGGPARYLAAARGCRVTGIDRSEPFVEAARYLTSRTGQADRVSFEVADALDLPFADAAFDVVLLQHVAMNVDDRAGLYRGIRRVLATGGRLAIFDIVVDGGDPHYPLPWATSPASSFLLTASGTLGAIERAGFEQRARQNDTEVAKAWFRTMRESGPPPAPNLGVVMGPAFADYAANLGRSLMEGRVGVLTAVFDAI